jgi:hypothetical protein
MKGVLVAHHGRWETALSFGRTNTGGYAIGIEGTRHQFSLLIPSEC